MTGFEVEWQRDTSVGCSDVNQGTISVNGDFTSYIITGLEPGNRYTITVTVSNSAGTAPVSNTVTAMTLETGEREYLTHNLSHVVLSSTAPTRPPDGVSELSVTGNSITVQWGEVLCLDRNGQITGYKVNATLNGTVIRTENVNDGSARDGTVSGLTPSTDYLVLVAAVNSAGTGPFSGIPIETEGLCEVQYVMHTFSSLYKFPTTRWTESICYLLNHYISDHLMGTCGWSFCYLILHLLLCH